MPVPVGAENVDVKDIRSDKRGNYDVYSPPSIFSAEAMEYVITRHGKLSPEPPD
jgi:hypothetical protein